ncbi:DUF2877 domain-containing protein [Nonomuraea sp. NPDC050404]|uniref:DUF2877 domain-containing protein n=1 Tax=Nonomuraea sp. NPDC050404 TaxID=3155783 RepID=UPI0033DB61C3
MVAVSKGYLVPGPDFAGNVHSVFATACNLAVDGRLLTVHDAASPHTPTSVRVTGWRPRAQAGDPARCVAGVLSFGEHVLDLRALPVWTPPSPAPSVIVDVEDAEDAEEVARIREQYVEAEGIVVPGLTERAESLLEALVGRAESLPGALVGRAGSPSGVLAGRAGSPSGEPGRRDVSEAVARLVGFGPGLTPSGDDLLVGVLAVLSRGGGGAAFHTLASVVRRHAGRTTDVGAHYLRLAAGGHFGEPIVNLVDALVTGAGRAAVPARTKAALRVGASSGADGVAGVLLGLRALGSCPDRKAA